MNKELKKYIKENLEKDNHIKNVLLAPFALFSKLKSVEYDEEFIEEDELQTQEDKKVCFRSSAVENYINSNNEYNSFQTMLFKLIDDKELIDSDVYNKVHIDRRLFSKIRNDKDYHPSKETVILLGLALELNEKEIDKLLESASYSLPKNNHYDLIIRFCFINGIYKIKDVNDLLDQYKCKLFSY